jgi:hypothetical protein
MTRRKAHRIPKSPVRNLADLEDHLYLLRGHLRGLKDDPAHIKALAAELRTLVCRSSGTEGLLWRLVDHYGVSDAVHLHVAGRVNPDHPLARGLSFFVALIQRPTAALEPKLPSAIHSFKAIIKECEAVWTLGMKSYTHAQLIKAVAEEVGSAHEDEGIEPGLSAIENILINGVAPYVPILAVNAELTLEVGERVLEHADAVGGYRRRRFSPPITMSLHMRLRERPAGSVSLAIFTSAVTGVAVFASLTPGFILFSVTKRGMPPLKLATPVPESWAAGQDAVFCLCYEHNKKRLHTLSPGLTGDLIEGCDLGFLEADLRPETSGTAKPYVEMVAAYIHVRVFSPDEVAHIHEILVEPPRVAET